MSILIKPVITEKTTRLQQQEQKFVFHVSKDATKPQIRKAVESMYPEVVVASVNTMIMPRKPKGRFTRGGYVDGSTSTWKKAIITLKSGTINLYEEV